jgi:hypothetical protein
VDSSQIQSIVEFIKLNSNVQHFKFGFEDSDCFYRDCAVENFQLISDALRFNNHLLSISGHFPMPKYYLERNKKFAEMDFHFPLKIGHVESFDLFFEFQ